MFSEVPQIARNWWMFVVLGFICLVTGILAIVWPDITLLTLVRSAGARSMPASETAPCSQSSKLPSEVVNEREAIARVERAVVGRQR